jgi:3-hydroxyisobutyrate dehydrogenase
MAIGMIGLGNIGYGVAINLLDFCVGTGREFIVFDRDANKLARLSKHGAIAASSIADLAQRCNIVFTSLPGPYEVSAVALGSSGLLANLAPKAVWFELSTNSVQNWVETRQLACSDLLLIDAPVSGGADGAMQGTLSLFAGADLSTIDPFRDILDAFCGRIFTLGGPGNGYITKLCQLHLNYLSAVGVCEVHNIAQHNKLDLEVFSQALNASCSASYVVTNYLPKIIDGSYDPSFSLGLAAKDTRLIADMVRTMQANVPLAAKIEEIYELANAELGNAAAHLSISKLLALGERVSNKYAPREKNALA